MGEGIEGSEGTEAGGAACGCERCGSDEGTPVETHNDCSLYDVLVFDLVLRRGDDEISGDAHALGDVGERRDVIDDGGAHLRGHLAVHEDEAEGVDEIAGVSGGVAGLGGRHAESAGGAEVDGEVGDLVVDEVVGESEAEDGAGGVLLTELGGVSGGAGDDVVRREEVEDAAGGIGLFAEGIRVVAEARVVADAGGVGCAEAAEDVGHVEHGLAEVAAVGSGLVSPARASGSSRMARMTACMSPRTLLPLLAKTAEMRGDIGGAGIAGHQMLDELAGDEGADVGVGEDVGQARLRGPARRFGRREGSCR